METARRSGVASLGGKRPRAGTTGQRRVGEGCEVGRHRGVFTAAGLWSQIAPYELVFKFNVSAGAIVVMFQAFRTRHYAFAAVFAALVLLYNPVAPVFSFTGDWQRFLVVASVLPFIAALAWPNRTEADNAQA